MINNEKDEALDILDVVLAQLLTTTKSSFELRQAIGNLKANASDMIAAGTIGSDLLSCFDVAQQAGVTLDIMDNVREAMLDEHPVYKLATGIKSSAITFSLVEQCNIISVMTFVSRTDVDVMMTRMNEVIETIKLEVSELLDGVDYFNVVSLSAALIQHLSATERQLPRIVHYTLPYNRASVTLAYMLYADTDRSEELIKENKVIHPAFMQREIRALSE